MRENAIEKHLRLQVEKHGGRAFKWVSPGNVGVPDRIVIFHGRRPFFVELKAPGKLLRGTQVRQHVILLALGQDVSTLDSVEAVDTWLCRILNLSVLSSK